MSYEAGKSGHIRDLLRVAQLDEFSQFCAGRGWIQVPTKGQHEVLRMWRKSATRRAIPHGVPLLSVEHC